MAHRFAELGCRLVLVARRMERLQALADSLHSEYSTAGCKCHTVCLDVRVSRIFLRTWQSSRKPSISSASCFVEPVKTIVLLDASCF